MSAILEMNENVVAAQPAIKTPVTRLLDMLVGWSYYVSGEEGQYPDTLTDEQIASLYQEAGGIADHDYPDSEAEKDAVCRFVIERVLAALFHS